MSVPVSEAGAGKAGEFLSPWLDLPMGARAGALGGAYTAVAEGGFAHLYNPAGLTQLTEAAFSSSFRSMSLDRKISFVALSFPVREQAIVALSWQYATTGTVIQRSSAGVPSESGAAIGQHEHQFSMVFGKKFSKRVSVGATVSYYQWKLDEISSNSALFDVGVLLFVDHFLHDRDDVGLSAINDIRVGFTMKAIGSSFQIDTDKFWKRDGGTIQAEIASRFVVGASGRALDDRLLLTSDISYHESFGLWGSFGLEYDLATQLALRVGANRGKPTAGVGFVFALGSRSLVLDYAFLSDRVDEGMEHLFSLEIGL
ncbi:hypothetical protein JYT16_00765 [Gemmatimonas aurantiaca]|nr:hypothetical protein [Gemmatimonas aurantiaca]